MKSRASRAAMRSGRTDTCSDELDAVTIESNHTITVAQALSRITTVATAEWNRGTYPWVGSKVQGFGAEHQSRKSARTKSRKACPVLVVSPASPRIGAVAAKASASLQSPDFPAFH